MFAPRHAVAAGEIARVVRPGGRIAITTWPVDGGIADFFRTVGKYMPPPPAVAEPPLLWGSEEHVRALFDDSGLELEFERGIVVMNKFESADAEIEFSLEKFGPMIMARHMTEASGSWPELRADLERLYDEQGEEFEYLVTLGHKP
jgi:SAM-dependent methyltransferase